MPLSSVEKGGALSRKAGSQPPAPPCFRAALPQDLERLLEGQGYGHGHGHGQGLEMPSRNVAPLAFMPWEEYGGEQVPWPASKSIHSMYTKYTSVLGGLHNHPCFCLGLLLGIPHSLIHPASVEPIRPMHVMVIFTTLSMCPCTCRAHGPHPNRISPSAPLSYTHITTLHHAFPFAF